MTELNKKRVLIVDDSALHRAHAEELLREIGITEITHAKDGNDALAVMANADYPPDLMLLDLEMPGMDGVELLQQLMHLHLHIDVVVVSSRENALLTTVEVMSQTLGIAILGALQKPLSKERLAAVLSHHSKSVGAKPKPAPYPLDVIVGGLNRGQFHCHFQPKVAIATGIIKGVEALARWQHPQHGVIAPDRFIDPLERNGAIMQRFTMALLDDVLKQMHVWHGGGLSLTVAVNISAQSFADSRFVEQVIKRVEDHGIDPKYLVLEVTETAIMTDIGASLGTLARLRLKGFGLAIDDYGTGFASLQQLSRIPATELKIDRLFVDGCHQRDHLIIMLESAVQLAAKLKLSVVAEGVEQEADWKVLQRIGCETAQGYLIAKPMPASDLLPWVKSEQKRLRELATSS